MPPFTLSLALSLALSPALPHSHLDSPRTAPIDSYKMPRLQSKIEGRGNGIKTVIPNMSDVAKALSRPSTYPTKFFGCELGAQVKCDEVNDRYIVNGAHEAAKLQSLLDGFISKFVLCGSCSNPETDLIVTSGRDPEVIRDCKGTC